MLFIFIFIVIIYFIYATWTWSSLGTIEKSKKALYIIIGTIIMYIITRILFLVSKNGIEYHEIPIESAITNVISYLFTGINGIIVFPTMAKNVIGIKEETSDVSKSKRKLMILAVVFIICMIVECAYMADIQKGIIEMYQAARN